MLLPFICSLPFLRGGLLTKCAKRLQVLGWIVGFILQDITLTVYIGLVGSLLAVFAAVPAWPMYNRHSLRWLPAGAGSASDQSEEGDGGTKVKKET